MISQRHHCKNINPQHQSTTSIHNIKSTTSIHHPIPLFQALPKHDFPCRKDVVQSTTPQSPPQRRWKKKKEKKKKLPSSHLPRPTTTGIAIHNPFTNHQQTNNSSASYYEPQSACLPNIDHLSLQLIHFIYLYLHGQFYLSIRVCLSPLYVRTLKRRTERSGWLGWKKMDVMRLYNIYLWMLGWREGWRCRGWYLGGMR